MGELLDLFIDFERKLVLLLKHLWTNPRGMVQSVVARERKYLSPFKFYSLIFSLWIIIIQVWHWWDGSFYDTDPDLPARLASFEAAYLDVMFLVWPFLFFIYWVITLGLVNFLMLRRPRYSLVSHLSFATYIGGMALLSMIPSIALAFIAVTILGDSELVLLISLFAIPFAFILQFTWKIYVNKWWACVKVVAAVLVISTLTAYLTSESDLHSLFLKKIAYPQYARYKIENNGPAFAQYTPSGHERFTGIANFLNSSLSHSRVAYRVNDNEDSVQYYLLKQSRTDSLAIEFHRSGTSVEGEELLTNYWHGEELNDTLSIITYSCDCKEEDRYLWKINPKTGKISTRISIPYIVPSSQFYFLNDAILFTGQNFNTKIPVIGQLDINNTFHLLDTLDDKAGFQIDTWLVNEIHDSVRMQMTFYRNDNNKLKELSWVSASFKGHQAHRHENVVLLKNDFSPSLNAHHTYDDRFTLHNTKLLELDNNHSALIYQVMTDSTFAIKIHKIDTDGQEVWQKTEVIPADFAVYHHAFLHNQKLILLGKAATYFPVDWSIDNTAHMFALTLNLESGEREALQFFDEPENILYYPASLYYRGHAFQDDKYIYWSSPSGRGSFKIDKENMLR